MTATDQPTEPAGPCVTMPAGLAAVYELWHQAAEDMRAEMRRSGGVPRGPVRFSIFSGRQDP